MAEKNIGFVSLVRSKLTDFVFGDIGKERPKTTEYIPQTDGIYRALKAMSKEWASDMYETTLSRNDKYKRYKNLDMNLAEASASLNVYADNIVSGAIGGEENYKVTIDPGASEAPKAIEVVEFTERKTGIKDYIWDIARDLTQDGDVMEEICIYGETKKGFYIGKLKNLPTGQIFANVDERGVWVDEVKPYYQKKEPTQSTKDAEFDWWRLIHFKVGRGLYGVDRSIFANASNRIGRQLIYIDDALVLARISRAWMRYAFFIDVTGLPEGQKWEFVDAFMSRVRRTDVVDRETGRINYIDAPLMPDEDIGIPVEKESAADVKTLVGDMNIGNIEDVHYLQTKFLMAMNMPKAYVAIEEGTRAKATLTQIDVQFARQVRRRQRALLPGLKKFYRIAFILAGLDPDAFKWDIVFPEMATTDEMLKWEMLKVKAEIAKILVVDVAAVNTDWVLEVILEMNEADIKRYKAILSPKESEGGGGGFGAMTLPAETLRIIKTDPYIRQCLEDFMDLVALKETNEEARRSMKEVGLKREKKLKDRE